MSTNTQKKIKSSVVILVIGLIISIVASVATNHIVSITHKDDEFHQSLMVASHQPSEYTVTLNKDVSDLDGITYPAGTPFHVFSLQYQLQDDTPILSLVYLPEGENRLNFVTDFNIEDINPSDELNNDIEEVKADTIKRHNDIESLKTNHKIKRVIIVILVFILVNLFSFFISKISETKKRCFLAFLFFVSCLIIIFYIFVITPYLGHH